MKNKILFSVTEAEVKSTLEYCEVPLTKANISHAKKLLKDHLETHAMDILSDYINAGEFI